MDLQNIFSSKNNLRIFAISTLIFQLLVIIMYGCFMRYLQIDFYPQDFSADIALSVFCLIGIGLILCYLRDLHWSSLGFTLLIFAIVFQYYFLINSFWWKQQNSIGLSYGVNNNYNSLNSNQKYTGSNQSTVFQSIKCALAIIIGFSSILGRGGPLEALIMTLIGVIFYVLSSHVVNSFAYDNGGSIKIFQFGGLFGFITGVIMNNELNHVQFKQNKIRSNKWSMTLAVIGVLFCWCLFPILNSSPLRTSNEIINTMKNISQYNCIFALSGSVMTTLLTNLIFKEKIQIKYIIHGTLSGGVAISTSANIILNPSLSLIVGIVTGLFQVLFQMKLSNFLISEYIRDTSSSLSVFGIPGIIGGLWSAIFIATSNKNQGLSSSGGGQLGAVVVVFFFAVLSGTICGFILRYVNRNTTQQQFSDSCYWLVQEDGISTLKSIKQNQLFFEGNHNSSNSLNHQQSGQRINKKMQQIISVPDGSNEIQKKIKLKKNMKEQSEYVDIIKNKKKSNPENI